MGLSEDLERVTLQERELQLPRMDEQMAWELGTRLRTMAEERSLPIVSTSGASGSHCFTQRSKAPPPTTSRGCNARAMLWRASIAAPTASGSQ
jgi:hypothetical protein